MRLAGAAALAAGVALALAAPARADGHAIAMHGAPKYGPGYTHFGYANADAPKGGTLALSAVGSFDSLSPFLVRGVPAAGLRYTFDGLLQRARDEPFTLYALLAESVEMADDRAWVAFELRPGARFHDGSEVTVDDVVFSLETLRDHGRPNHRLYYSQVAEMERVGARGIRLHFTPTGNREMPLIMGLMPILPKHYFAGRDFKRVPLEPIPGTGVYRIETVDAGRRIVYRRVPNHWSEGLPAARGQNNFERIVYDYYRDEAARRLAFQRGDVHVVVESDPRRFQEADAFPGAEGGRVLKRIMPNGRPAEMFALAWNARRPLFAEPAVRRALGQAFDFEWVNKNFFQDAYRRTDSFVANSDLAATGAPSPAELALLAPFREGRPDGFFDGPYLPPGDRRQGSLRERLRDAGRALAEAGYVLREQTRVEAAGGRPFSFEIMLARREDERLALTFADNLRKLGIEARVRLVDGAQYQERLAAYDFDAIFFTWDQSLSPGNEQAFYWGSAAATQQGTRNYAGIADPAVDAMIAHVVDARTRDDLVAAYRALDRLLLWGEYALPMYHDTGDRLVYWDRFGIPEPTPLYGYQIETWWEDAEKAARLSR